MIWFILVFWLLCGFLAAIYNFAYYQRKWPRLRKSGYHADAIGAIALIPFGFAALLSTVLLAHCTRGVLIPYSKKSKLEAGLE